MNEVNVEQLADHIKTKNSPNGRVVIAISGFGGAGKTTISDRLSALLGSTTIIHADDFVAANERGALDGYHLDWEKLEELVLKPAKSAKTITSRIYDWKSNHKVSEQIDVSQYLIIEGSIGLIQAKYKQYFDLTVWVDVPQDIANERSKKRDREEYRVDRDQLWNGVWGPREKDSFNKLQPAKNSDLLLRT